jgi:N-acetylmuramoyl-L-alanine amidase
VAWAHNRELDRIDTLIIHCTATPPHMDIGAKTIDRWHKERGWSGIGYHIVIRRDGTEEYGRPLHTIGAHAKGNNINSIGLVYVGGVNADGKPDDNRTTAQRNTMEKEVKHIIAAFPGIRVIGHNEVSSKACPSFDVQAWMREINWNGPIRQVQ